MVWWETTHLAGPITAINFSRQTLCKKSNIRCVCQIQSNHASVGVQNQTKVPIDSTQFKACFFHTENFPPKGKISRCRRLLSLRIVHRCMIGWKEGRRVAGEDQKMKGQDWILHAKNTIHGLGQYCGLHLLLQRKVFLE